MELTEEGSRQIKRLGTHLGLMSVLLQRGAPMVLIQSQALSLRNICRAVVDLDEREDAYVQVSQLLDDDTAKLLGDDFTVPNDLEGLAE